MSELKDIRSWNGSQHEAFEELCCQLASTEYPCSQGEFRRVRGAGGDAGVEGYWLFTDGSKHGWQAKFFSEVGTNQWSQIDDSVQTAIKKHPELTNYTVCLPIDRTEGKKTRKRSNGKAVPVKSMMDYWNEHVTKWTAIAESAGITVEFHYWGHSEIFERLSRSEHRGRRYFWFNDTELTRKWFEERLAEALETAGPRYTRETNVELPISGAFDAVARTDAFYDKVVSLRNSFKTAVSKLHTHASIDPQITSTIGELHSLHIGVLSAFPGEQRDSFSPLDFNSLKSETQILTNAADRCMNLLRDAIAQYKSSDEYQAPSGRANQLLTTLEDVLSKILNILDAADRITSFCDSSNANISNTGALLITGEAGQGKTHLSCDTSEKRLKDGLATVVLFGEQFNDEEPWSQIIKLLHLSCKSPDELVGALQSFAEAKGRRSLIVIDALNETDNRGFWRTHLPAMIQFLKKYPGVALAVTCRSSYEPLVIPEHIVPGRLVLVTHQGFAGHEGVATSTFFRRYGIEEPNIPLLQPEFTNPLFLILFCQALQSEGYTRIPGGYRGITAILGFFTKAAHKKLSLHMDYDPKTNYVDLALDTVADYMADNRLSWVLRQEAKVLVNSLLPGRPGYNESLYANLVHEGLLVENIHWREDEQIEGVRMGFEKFTDHLVVHALLQKHLDRTEPKSSFHTGHVLGDLFSDQYHMWSNRGWIEALSVQIPEQLECELVDLVPEWAEHQVLQESFLQSLVWRDPTKITKSTDAYFNQVYKYRHKEVYSTLLMLAADPAQHYNARSLHEHLKKRSMPKRDHLWSIFLHDHYGNDDSVDRLLEWAWHADKSHICDESIELSGMALTWYLTTSNRFVRDRATKALVSLLRNKPNIMCKLIEAFDGVDDLYVLERLYATAYGVAMLTTDNDAVGQLAQCVYNHIFAGGQPIPHLLLRDYARGVVEVAARRGALSPDIDLQEIRPPYSSAWPLDVPDKSKIDQLCERREHKDDADIATWAMCGSVMGKALGDFSSYVIGRHAEWSSQQINEGIGVNKTTTDRFVNSLTSPQKRAWDKVQRLQTIAHKIFALGNEQKNQLPLSDDDVKRLSGAALSAFLKSLGKRKRAIYDQYVASYLEVKTQNDSFDMDIARRWIVNRVFTLGWTPELFGTFDRWLNYGFRYGRSGHKPERIGKKYQWIALHEFLAHLADHCFLRESYYDPTPMLYDNPSQIGRRDIDPSFLLDAGDGEVDENDPISPWWQPIKYHFTEADWNQKELWTLDSDDTPSPAQLIDVVDSSETHWLSLYSNYTWTEPDAHESHYDKPWRKMWFHVRCYLVRREHSDSVFAALKSQGLYGKHLSELGTLHQVYLGEYPWASSCEQPEVKWDWIESIDGETPLPQQVAITAMDHVGISEYDCSVSERASGLVPSAILIDAMKLDWGRDGFSFVDGSGRIAICDPSIRQGGKGALLLNKDFLLEFLNNREYDLIWTILGAREFHKGPEAYTGTSSLSGAYRFENNTLTGCMTEYIQSHPRSENLTTEWQGRTIHKLP